MPVATDLLDHLAAVGAIVEAAGNRLVVRAGPKPVPGELVRRLREAKAEILATLAPTRCKSAKTDAAWWRREFTIRTIDRELAGARSHAEAAWLAWGELLNQWHKRHGRRWPASQCAGCGRPLRGLPALNLSDGNRVHFDKLGCLLSFGARWRNEATAGLRALGLDPPTAVVPL